NEVVVADSASFLGAQDPNYQATLNTDITFFKHLSVHASVAYQNGLTQFDGAGLAVNSQGSNFLTLAANNPKAPLGQQAAVAVMDPNNPNVTYIGAYQTVNTWRLSYVSVVYILPDGFARRLRCARMSLALEGTNLALLTNYRGKDPNVNAASTGNEVEDFGGIPIPRTWRLRINLSN
ncbi:MAG TPA: hypothetical protein VNW46_02390, partial [Gemmatimonadaceae bacterium]|nr:hypothetical protein [Gemmatimonadaceae bacterium]